MDNGKAFTAVELTIVERHRFEGASDPDDESVVYAFESRDGTRGNLVDAFGPYANPGLSSFLQKVRIRQPV